MRIVSQAIDGLPEGPWIADDRKVVLPPRHELSTSMESLIHHFKLVTEGFRVPPGEVYHAIEGPRGELGCFVVADGSAKPARVHFRDSSFVNLQCPARHVPRRVRRRHDPEPGDARPDPGRHRPVSEENGHRLRPTDDLTAEERDELIDSMTPEDADRVPELHEVDVPRRAAGADRDGDVALPAAALGLDPGAVGGPAPLRLVLARRHPPGGRGDGPHPRLPAVGRELLRPLPHRARGQPPGARLPQHLLLDERRRRAAAARSARPPASTSDAAAPRRRAPPPTASSTCRASSAWAPATWRRWPRSTRSTTARSSSPTPGARSTQLRSGERRAARQGTRPPPGAAGGPEPEPDRGSPEVERG